MPPFFIYLASSCKSQLEVFLFVNKMISVHSLNRTVEKNSCNTYSIRFLNLFLISFLKIFEYRFLKFLLLFHCFGLTLEHFTVLNRLDAIFDLSVMTTAD